MKRYSMANPDQMWRTMVGLGGMALALDNNRTLHLSIVIVVVIVLGLQHCLVVIVKKSN